MTLGKKIRSLREYAGMTQVELANRLGISGGTISKYESDTLEPNVGIIKEIVHIFSVTADYLIDDECIQPVASTHLSENEVELINFYRANGGGIVDEKEYEVIRMYRDLLPEEKGEVRGLMRGLSLKRNDESPRRSFPNKKGG